MAPTANFTLPVVFENLRDPESLHQLLDSLEALDKVAEEIFSRITTRVEKNKSDLASIRSRLTAAEGKIEQVRQRSGAATTIYSPFTYPGKSQLEDYTSVTGWSDAKELKRATFSLPPISAEEEEKERSQIEDSSLFEYSANATKRETDTGELNTGPFPRPLQEPIRPLQTWSTRE